MGAERPQVGLVTVHYRNLNVTQALMQCVQKCQRVKLRAVIVNNSPEQAASLGSLIQPNIQIVETGHNLGYAGGVNCGLRVLMSEADMEWVIVVNNDITFEPDLIAEMISSTDRHSVRSPVLLYRGSDMVQNTGGRISYWLGGTRNLNKNRPWARVKPCKPDFLSGAFMLMHRSVVDKVGLFDESYHSYYEDVDYSLRVKKMRLTIEIDWQAHAWHAHSVSTRDQSEFKRYLITRNQIRFARRWLSGWRRVLFLVSGLTRSFLTVLLRGRFRSYWSGVKDGFADLPNG